MSFLFINKTLRLNNLKTRIAMNVKLSVFVIYVEAIIYLSLHNLRDCCTFESFVKFTTKHLCWSVFFDKVAGLKSLTLLEKRLQHRCFPVNFAKFLRTPFFTEHLQWLLLIIASVIHSCRWSSIELHTDWTFHVIFNKERGCTFMFNWFINFNYVKQSPHNRSSNSEMLIRYWYFTYWTCNP